MLAVSTEGLLRQHAVLLPTVRVTIKYVMLKISHTYSPVYHPHVVVKVVAVLWGEGGLARKVPA